MSGDLTPAPSPESEGDQPLDGEALTLDALDGEASRRSGSAGEPSLTPPEAVGRFRILGTLGAGGMGVVYLAEDPSLGRKVAIKLLHADRAGRASAQARLQREARALASLSHPNVVVVHEVGVHEDQVYLVMEHVAGQTLHKWARAHAGDWAAIVAQYRAAGEGLAAAHRAGIIHRDFKPENVLVDDDGRPRVLDFGLASPGVEAPSKEASWDELGPVDLTKTGTILGTPAYMAPEQFLGATVDARTDQFSFCVALWEALFGRRPFAGDDVMELRRRVLAGQRRRPPARARIPRSIVDALSRGLSVEPDQRFATMSELLEALSELHPRRRGLGIAAAVMAVGGLVATAWLVRDPAQAVPRARGERASPVVDGPAEPTPTPLPQEHPVLSPRTLTHTTGYGVLWAGFDREARVMTYMARDAGAEHGQWWQLPLSSPDATPMTLSTDINGMVHHGPEGSHWLVDDDSIVWVGPDGAVQRRIDRGDREPEPVRSHSWISPNGESIAIESESGFEIWDLGQTDPEPEPVLVELVHPPWGLAWSPDSSRIATIVRSGWEASYRFDVLDASGSLRSSTPWPEAVGGQPLRGLVWLSSGPVVLLSDGSQAWVQCMRSTEAGLTTGRRSAGMATSPHTELADAIDDHTLLVVWPEVQGEVVLLELLGDRAQQLAAPFEVRRSKGEPSWLSDDELVFLAAEPPGALVKVDLDDLGPPEVLAPGPFEWVSSDGEGGWVVGSADGETIEYLASGATSPRRLRLPGVGSSSPHLRCRTPRDCVMTSSGRPDSAFLTVDLQHELVRRRFACPKGLLCGGRWGLARDGAVLVVDQQQRELSRLDAKTGDAIGEPRLGPPWATIQSATETSRGELVLTGMSTGDEPVGDTYHPYRVMRLGVDGAYQVLWSSERTWVVRPRASPGGRRVALEGLTFHSELVALELGSLCETTP